MNYSLFQTHILLTLITIHAFLLFILMCVVKKLTLMTSSCFLILSLPLLKLLLSHETWLLDYNKRLCEIQKKKKKHVTHNNKHNRYNKI